MILKFVKFCVIPSFFPIIAVTVEERAKLAPKFAPKLVAFETPDVEAIAFVTALPSVFAIDVPVVFATVFEMVLVIPFVIVSAAFFPSVLAVPLVRVSDIDVLRKKFEKDESPCMGR